MGLHPLQPVVGNLFILKNLRRRKPSCRRRGPKKIRLFSDSLKSKYWQSHLTYPETDLLGSRSMIPAFTGPNINLDHLQENTISYNFLLPTLESLRKPSKELGRRMTL